MVWSDTFTLLPGLSTESTDRDEIETVLEINGEQWRETGSYGYLRGNSKANIILQGSVIIDLMPGDYSVVLLWKNLITSKRSWYSTPMALDGFAMGRTLVAVGERHFDRISVYAFGDQYRQTAVGEWSDVGDSVLQFSLPTATRVTLSYNLPLSQSDNPQFSSWSSAYWNRIQTRLVIDGVAYRHLSSYVDGSVRGIKNSKASMVLSLAGGSHTGRLQWQNVDGYQWTSVSFITDAASSYASVFLFINPWNNDPKIIASNLVNGREDVPLVITGISISDVKEVMALDYQVSIRMAVQHGTLTLQSTAGITYASGKGVRNEFILFSGPLSKVNAVLATITYQSFSNWYGSDTLLIRVIDQESTGFGFTATSGKEITLRIASVNDPPQLIVPAAQFVLEDEEASIFGVSVFDVDVSTFDSSAMFEVQLYVISGVISLAAETNITFLEGSATAEQFMHFRGDLQSVNAALFEILYQPNHDFNSLHHAEQLGIRVIDYNNRDQTVSEVSDVIVLHVQSENDPVVILPSEMFTTIVRGYSVGTTVGGASTDMIYVRLQTTTLSGRIGFMSDVPNSVVKLPPSDGPSSWIHLNGPTQVIQELMKSISYFRTPSFSGYEVLRVQMSHLSDFTAAEDTAVLLGLTFNNSAQITVFNISPSRGRAGGSTKVTVVGKGFNKSFKYPLKCQFGANIPVLAETVSDEMIICISPPNKDAFRATFLMITDGETLYSNPVAFEYEWNWNVKAIRPSTGPAIGGSSVYVQGENFPNTADLMCTFGNITVPAIFTSESSVHCTSPPQGTGLPRNVSLRLTTNTQEYSESFAFNYTGMLIILMHSITSLLYSCYCMYSTELPQVIGITPNYGQSGDITNITIVGSHFFSASTLGCIFGGLYVTSGTYISSSAILCMVPPISLASNASSQNLTVDVAFDNAQYLSPRNFTIYGK